MPLPADLTVADLKLRLDKQLVADDDFLEALLEAAYLAAQAPAPYGCGRLLAPDPAPQGDPDTSTPVALDPVFVSGRLIRVPDARELTGVAVTDVDNSTTYTLAEDTDYDVLRKDGLVIQLELLRNDSRWIPTPDRRPRRKVVLTGRFGFATLPADLREAIYVLAGRMFYERDAQYADQVVDVEGGSAQAYFRQLPPRAKLAFARYRVPLGIAGLP